MNRYGTEKDLYSTPYIHSLSVNGDDYKLHFSTQNRMNRFKRYFKSEVEKMNIYLLKKFGVECECEGLAIVKLYTDIEKEGFLIYINDKRFMWGEICVRLILTTKYKR